MELKTESTLEPVFDEWLGEMCRTHNVEFLTNVVLKIFQGLLDHTDLKTESQQEVARRLFPEIERMYHHFRSICEPSLLSEETDISSALIRDIGERIVQEVRRRFSDSHQ